MKMLNNKKGFTVIEIIVVMVIIGILVAIAVPVYQSVTNKAIETTLVMNVRSSTIFVFNSIGEFDDAHLFSDNYDDEDTLAKHLEIELERFDTPDESNDYENKHGFGNPVSDSQTILHYKDVSGVSSLFSGTVANPSVFITGDSKCDPTNLNLSEGEAESVKGTIVIYIRNNYMPVYVYAIDQDGNLLNDTYEEVYR